MNDDIDQCQHSTQVRHCLWKKMRQLWQAVASKSKDLFGYFFANGISTLLEIVTVQLSLCLHLYLLYLL